MNFAALGRLGTLVISFGIHVIKIFSSVLNILIYLLIKPCGIQSISVSGNKI